MPEKVSLDDLDERDVDVEGFEPRIKPVGYHLEPDELRPSVWVYDEGESNREHKHEVQEELYVVLDGRVHVSFEDGDLALGPDEFTVVAPDTWRQITAVEEAIVLAVGAPGEAHDAVFPDDE